MIRLKNLKKDYKIKRRENLPFPWKRIKKIYISTIIFAFPRLCHMCGQEKIGKILAFPLESVKNVYFTTLSSLHTLSFQNMFIFLEPPYIIMEYAGRGNLQLLLRAYRLRWTQDPESMSPYANAPPVKKLTSRDLTIFGLEVARGMEYIASKEV